MLFEKRTPRRSTHAQAGQAEHADHSGDDDPAVFPIAVPLVAGPGAMATMVLLTSQRGGLGLGGGNPRRVVRTVLAVTLGLFLIASRLDRIIGKQRHQRADAAVRDPAGGAGGADRAGRADAAMA